MSARDFCTVTASTKRGEGLANGIIGPAIEYLTGVAITPLWPVTAATAESAGLSSPREYKEAYHIPAAGDELPDIVEGDLLVVEGEEYIVESAAEWGDISATGVPTLQLVVQEVKRAWAAA